MVRHGEHLVTSLVRKFHLIQNPMELVFRIAAECAPVSIVIQGEHPPAGGELHRIGVCFRVEGDSLVQAEIVVELEQFLPRGRRGGQPLITDTANRGFAVVMRCRDKDNALASFPEAVKLWDQLKMALLFAVAAHVARDEEDINFALQQPIHRRINDRPCFGQTFLVALAAPFIGGASCAEARCIVMQIRYQVKFQRFSHCEVPCFSFLSDSLYFYLAPSSRMSPVVAWASRVGVSNTFCTAGSELLSISSSRRCVAVSPMRWRSCRIVVRRICASDA